MTFLRRVDFLVLSLALACTSACSDKAPSNADDASVVADMETALDANVAIDMATTVDANVAIDMSTSSDAGVDTAEDATTPVDAAEPDAAAPAPTTLAASANDLAVAASGTARIVIVTNVGTESAFDFTLDVSPAWPSGTTQTSTCGATLAPSSSCTVTITPGSTPSSTPGLASVPSTVTIAGSNTNSLSVNVHVLDYGNIYQGGYVFAIDDTTPNTGSIGGKVAANRNQTLRYPEGVLFGATADGSGITVSYDNIPGIDETSTPTTGGCNGAVDGACNSNAIVAYYSSPSTDPSVPLFYYAAGICAGSIDGYADWYLPAICELGYDQTGNGSGCGTPESPLLQNMQSNLVDNGDIGGIVSDLRGFSNWFWSSTSHSANPTTNAWSHSFGRSGESGQSQIGKSNRIAIRCARALTY